MSEITKYKKALKNLSYDTYRLCKEFGWEINNTDIETIKELIKNYEVTKMALQMACEEMIEDLHFDSEDDRHYTLQENIEYFKAMARKNIRGE